MSKEKATKLAGSGSKTKNKRIGTPSKKPQHNTQAIESPEETSVLCFTLHRPVNRYKAITTPVNRAKRSPINDDRNDAHSQGLISTTNPIIPRSKANIFERSIFSPNNKEAKIRVYGG